MRRKTSIRELRSADTTRPIPSVFPKPRPKTARFHLRAPPQGQKKGESVRRRPLPSRAFRLPVCAAKSQSRPFIRTSSRREVIRRVWQSPVRRPRVRPPRSRFSWTRFSVLQRLSGASSADGSAEVARAACWLVPCPDSAPPSPRGRTRAARPSGAAGPPSARPAS